MAAETALWDDSALINAFDKAMSKYKEMHKGGYQADHSEEDEVSAGVDNQEDVVSDETVRDTNVNAPQEDIDLARNLELKSHTVEALASEESQLNLEAHIQDGDSRTLIVEEAVANEPSQLTDYNQLLSQYYAIEEQRQKILEQLYQASTENTLSSSYMTSNLQYPYHPNQYSSCMACCCACSGAAYSLPPCNFGGQCVPGDPSTAPSHSQVNVLGPVEKAAGKIIPPTTTSTDISNSGAENVKESSHVSMGNDNGFSDALNAWYTAGFYTAMYLNGKSANDMGR